MRKLYRLWLVAGGLLFIGMLNGSQAQVKEVEFNQLKQYLHKNNDTLYVINFWATWCKPCVAELPHFKKINRNFRKDRVSVILVSLDFSKNLDSKVKPFVQKRKIKSRVFFLHQPRGDDWMTTLDPDWSGAIPATLFIKNGGNARAFYEKEFQYQELHNIVKRLKTR